MTRKTRNNNYAFYINNTSTNLKSTINPPMPRMIQNDNNSFKNSNILEKTNSNINKGYERRTQSQISNINNNYNPKEKNYILIKNKSKAKNNKSNTDKNNNLGGSSLISNKIMAMKAKDTNESKASIKDIENNNNISLNNNKWGKRQIQKIKILFQTKIIQ